MKVNQKGSLTIFKTACSNLSMTSKSKKAVCFLTLRWTMTKSPFINAMQTNDVLGENGMPTSSTSGSAVLDLFATQGAARGLSDTKLSQLFARAFKENPHLALRSLFYCRDVRQGQGERRAFRVMFRWLCENAPAYAVANLSNVPLYGRWDDVLVAVGTSVEPEALALYTTALEQGNVLAAKWAPRERKAHHDLANVLRSFMLVDWATYRRRLAEISKSVEQQMCARKWEQIVFDHVPSQASYRYRKAFNKRATAQYQAYLSGLKVGERKINAKAVHPHEIVREATRGIDETLEAQWNALPNWLEDGQSFLPVCDVSGSMTGDPMMVSLALGVYLAERNHGPFHGATITFSSTPEFIVFNPKASLKVKLDKVRAGEWGGSTNLEAVFRMVLKRARDASLAPEHMPKSVLILSDMQFDASRSQDHSVQKNLTPSAYQMIDAMYAEHGYTRPRLVFWNLRASIGVPAKVDTAGTMLVSGFSPSIMRSLLTGKTVKEPTPMDQLLATLEGDRYAPVVTIL